MLLAKSPGLFTVTVALEITQLNEALLDAALLSVTVITTELVPAVVGVPVITPVAELIDSPAGRVPPAAQVSVKCPLEAAGIVSGVMATWAVDAWAPGLTTVTTSAPDALITQENVAVPEAPVVSVTVTVTELVATTVGVPVMCPVEALIESPAGRPVAE
jgi:hypothetical protein